MTTTSYFLAKIWSSFGIGSKEKYHLAAAFEAQLLRESESIIGELFWDQLEPFEEVSTEYWRLRKIQKKEREMASEVEHLEASLEEAQEARTKALEEVAETTRDKVEARDQLGRTMQRLLQEKEEIQKEGRAVKRAHAGCKSKLEVLLEEANGDLHPEIESTREELKEKRLRFEKIKIRCDKLEGDILVLQEKLNVLNQEIEEENRQIRERAESQFGMIGKVNKELTALKSSLGISEAERISLCSEIGRFLIENEERPELRKILNKEKALMKLVREVRKSNNRLHQLL